MIYLEQAIYYCFEGQSKIENGLCEKPVMSTTTFLQFQGLYQIVLIIFFSSATKRYCKMAFHSTVTQNVPLAAARSAGIDSFLHVEYNAGAQPVQKSRTFGQALAHTLSSFLFTEDLHH